MNHHRFRDALRDTDPVGRTGRVRKLLSTLIEADGPAVPLGALCSIAQTSDRGAASPLMAEVVRIDRDAVVLVPLDRGARIAPGATVTAAVNLTTAPVGDNLRGRVVDALARPLDGRTLHVTERYPLTSLAPAPLSRTSPARAVQTGVRAIDGLLTLGVGQRVGIFAASGVGKTSLMTQLARQVVADRCVICLIGERGREVEALWSSGLDDDAKARTLVIAATSDETAAMRVRAANYALAVADHWRSQGHHVLLLLNSVTRLAMAMREIGLAAGEPPTVRAYTPGVFAAIPALVERCGAVRTGGAITAIMTVLSETDDVDDPICELMKSLLDGHIILSRELAELGHFPAIDVPGSISRQAAGLVDSELRSLATEAVRLLSTYQSSKTLIDAGVYVSGSNKDIDEALARRPALLAYLAQASTTSTGEREGRSALAAALGRNR